MIFNIIGKTVKYKLNLGSKLIFFLCQFAFKYNYSSLLLVEDLATSVISPGLAHCCLYFVRVTWTRRNC